MSVQEIFTFEVMGGNIYVTTHVCDTE